MQHKQLPQNQNNNNKGRTDMNQFNLLYEKRKGFMHLAKTFLV
jgi:hypothetical protein